MRFLERPRRIFAYGRPVDMRKSFQGLCALTQHTLKEDPLSGDIFLFFNRRGNYLKVLLWDRSGYCVVAKRLERGRFLLPRSGEKIELDMQSFSLLFDGIGLGARVRVA